MKIAVDMRWIFWEFSGIGFYTRELVRHMLPLAPEDEFILLFQDAEVRDRMVQLPELQEARNWRAEMLSEGIFSIQGQMRIPGRLRRWGVDLFHSPNWMVPYLAFPRGHQGRIRLAVTIHDLIPLVLPDHAPRSLKSRLFPVFRQLMLETGRRADLILTPSECSRRDVLNHLRPAHPEQVVSIPEAAAEHFTPADAPRAEPPELLYVGRFDPYKNVPGLIRAFAEVAAVHSSVRLRLIGSPDPRYPEAQQLAEKLGLNDRITWQGYVDTAGLIQAYRNAATLVFLSQYEGFGLPVLESMACGTPVICSNRSSLPEVAGQAALLVDPEDPKAVKETILLILNNSEKALELSQKSLEQSRQFSWTQTAAATLRMFKL